jgi:hypothetical protein
MKKALKFVVLCSALLFAVAAFSAERSVRLYSPVNLNGTTLKAGEYNVRYTVNGSNVDVQFLQGKKTIASTSAQLVEARKTNRDMLVTDNGSDGNTKLVSIQFANQPNAISFANAGTGGGN